MKRLIVHGKQSVWNLQSLIGIVLDNNITKIMAILIPNYDNGDKIVI